MIPFKVIKAMKNAINKKNLSDVLTKKCWINDREVFVGTDSFILFEFYPKHPVNTPDFSINYKQILALEKLCTNWVEIKWKTHIGDVCVIEFKWDDWVFYLPQIDHAFPTYRQEELFGRDNESITWIYANNSLKTYMKICDIIQETQYPVIKIMEKVYYFEHEDDLWKYVVSCRLHTETETDEEEEI